MGLLSGLKALFVGREAEEPQPAGDPERVREVQAVLNEMRPSFLSDGGDMRLVRVDDDGGVVLRLLGACNGCGAVDLTLMGALRPKIAERCDWFRELRTENG